MIINKMNSQLKYFLIFSILVLLVAFSLAACQPEALPPGDLTGRVYLDENANAECETCDCDFYLEGIMIQLYEGNCGGVVIQTVETDADGVFLFTDLTPGEYCVSPKVKLLCEGYQPTTPIQQVVTVTSGEAVEAPWFGFDHYLDIND